MRAVILGGADSVWNDLEKARSLATFNVVLAVNNAGRDYRGNVDHWCSFHSELFPHWIAQRRKQHLSDAGAYWTYRRRSSPDDVSLNFVEHWGGSSGLIAVQAALQIGATRIVLCGVPLDPASEHYDRPGRWEDAIVHRKAWERRAKVMDGLVRSMGGWTAELLGRPTREWITTTLN